MSTELLLRRGLVDSTGSRHRRSELRPLDGHQEAVLADGGVPDEQAVHELLAACLVRLGGYRAVTPEHTAALTRGDRQRLGLALRRLMFGDALVLTLRCPAPACAELADLQLRVGALLGTDAGEPAEPERWTVPTPDGPLRLRAPTGADDEVCAALAGDVADRAAALWDRLIDPADAPSGWAGLAAQSRQLLARALAESGTSPDLMFVSTCPACAGLLELELDPFELLARELAVGTDRLLAEVHCLAFHYCWSEAEILALPRPRRWHYLELLRRQVEGRPLS